MRLKSASFFARHVRYCYMVDGDYLSLGVVDVNCSLYLMHGRLRF